LEDAGELVHQQIQECEFDRRKQEFRREEELRELQAEEQRILAKLDEIRDLQRVNRQQVVQDRVDFNDKVKRLQLKLVDMEELQAQCLQAIRNCSTLLALTNHFSEYVDSLCGIVIEVENVCAASSSSSQLLTGLLDRASSASSSSSATADPELARLGSWLTVISRIATIVDGLVKSPCTSTGTRKTAPRGRTFSCLEKRRLLHESIVICFTLICQTSQRNKSALLTKLTTFDKEMLATLSALFKKAAQSIETCPVCSKNVKDVTFVEPVLDENGLLDVEMAIGEGSPRGTVLVLCDPRTIKHMVPGNLHERSTRIIRIMNRLVKLECLSEDSNFSMKPQKGKSSSKTKLSTLVGGGGGSSSSSSNVAKFRKLSAESRESILGHQLLSRTSSELSFDSTSGSQALLPKLLKCLFLDESQVEPVMLWDCIRLAHSESYIKYISQRCLRAATIIPRHPQDSEEFEGCCVVSGPYCCLPFKEMHFRLPSREVAAVRALDEQMREDGLIKFKGHDQSKSSASSSGWSNRGIEGNKDDDKSSGSSSDTDSVTEKPLTDAPRQKMARSDSNRSFGSSVESFDNSGIDSVNSTSNLQSDYFELCGNCTYSSYSSCPGRPEEDNCRNMLLTTRFV
jgi:hypothetical protein